MTDWVEDARVTPFPQVAAQLGMAMRAKRWGPCPACGASSTNSDRRPPIGRVNGKGWVCNACRAGGDVLDLVSFSVNGVRASKAGRAFKEIKVFFEDGACLEHDVEEPQEMKRVPEAELRSVLSRSMLARESREFKVARFLVERNYTNPPAWVLPAGWTARWWPWADFPLVVPAFTGSGMLAGLHGRAVDATAKRKTTWPWDADSRGLLFADPALGLPLLRLGRRPPRVLIVEGMTDYLWAAEDQRGRSAVLGISSGAIPALRAVDFSGIPVFIGADDDKAGRRYRDAVANAISPAPCRILPLSLARQAAAT